MQENQIIVHEALDLIADLEVRGFDDATEQERAVVNAAYGRLLRLTAMIEPQVARIKELYRTRTEREAVIEHGFSLALGSNPQFDVKAFVADYPESEYPHLYESKPSTAARKKFFSPDELEKYTSQGEAKVLFKAVD